MIVMIVKPEVGDVELFYCDACAVRLASMLYDSASTAFYEYRL